MAIHPAGTLSEFGQSGLEQRAGIGGGIRMRVDTIVMQPSEIDNRAFDLFHARAACAAGSEMRVSLSGAPR